MRKKLKRNKRRGKRRRKRRSLDSNSSEREQLCLEEDHKTDENKLKLYKY